MKPEESWQKPSVYSWLVIATVLGLIAWLVRIDKLAVTEGLIAAILGVLTWITKGGRPAVADKIPTPGKKDDDDDKPPPPPVSTSLIPPAMLLAFMILMLAGCPQPMTPEEKTAAAEASYRREMTACVTNATALEDSKACRQRVRERWNVANLDGGAE